MLGRLSAAAVLVVAALSSIAARPAPAPIRIGALFPLQGIEAPLAQQEYAGVRTALAMVNAQGGVGGRQLSLDSRELDTPAQAQGAVDSLRDDGVAAIVGTYSSSLSLPASAAAAADGVVYWEAGAVADQVTGRALPGVFRVGAAGSNLGHNSATFAATELVPRLGRTAATTRVSVVLEDDAYGRSVGESAFAEARQLGLDVVSHTTYNAYQPDWSAVFSDLDAARPDIVILASYIPDGVQFRHEMLRRGFHTGALIGSTMAECGPDFGNMLGADAVGVFASDRPTQGFNENALSPDARSLYDQFSALWRPQTGSAPTEEGLAGFTAGWALFHDVLPRAAGLDRDGVDAAAMALNIPQGGLPNGAGLLFSHDSANLGQNQRADAVIWQWQGVRHSVTVWPAVLATGGIAMVPLPR